MSVFTFLNRIIHEKADPVDAKDLMNLICSPNTVWEDFIDEILGAHDIDYIGI